MTIGDDTVEDFFYDQAGQPYYMKYNGTVYYYILNQQGDVVRIVSRTGASCGIYKYDAWGNILYQSSGTVMSINPLRYRGYVYDEETGFYYVSSRYYDPEVGRWINADDPEILFENQDNILENNLYTYCFNNPVNYYDLGGYLAITISAATFYTIYQVVLNIGVTVMISERIYRVVTYEKSGRYKYRIQLEEQNKVKKKKKKQSKKSGKEKADDAPSWAKQESYDKNKNAHWNTENVMNKKYGKNKWKNNPKKMREFSQIKKWLQRSKGFN